MRVSKVTGRNFKGRDFTVKLAPVTVIVADNYNWKSAVPTAVRLGLTGWLPLPIGRLGLMMMADKAWRRVVGTDAPVDLRRLDWVTRAAELRLPVLLVHSDDDEFVPSGPSRRLAQARPDLVTFVSFPHARHCREWNTDPDRWEREVARFLLQHL